jgi:hypothetical protein
MYIFYRRIDAPVMSDEEQSRITTITVWAKDNEPMNNLISLPLARI